MKKLVFLGILVISHWAAPAQDLTYQTPPKAIADLVDAPITPRVSIAADGKWMLLLDVQDLPSIADLSQPELRMAGLRLNPRTNGPSRVSYSTALRLKRLPTGAEIDGERLARPAKISEVSWSPDETKIAFALTTEATAAAGGQIQLWVLDVATATARQLPGVQLNSVFGTAYQWVPDNQTIIARTVLANRGQVPDATAAPTGPIVQENVGRTAAARTYQDLLKNPADEKMFDYYATTQLMKVSLDGKTQPLGQPGVIQQASPSPDGKYILVKTRHRPYSYQLTVGSFPVKVDVLDASGNW